MMNRYKALFAPGLVAALLATSCTDTNKTTTEGEKAAQTATKAPVSLKEAFEGDFYVGAALNGRQVSGNDAKALNIIQEQFNTISPENLLKWESVHPRPNEYNFEPADNYVALGEQHDLFTVGHTLVWHNQTPKWVFEDAQGKPVSKEELLKRMQDHISTVAGRYKGKIDSWDVVNEALNDDGTLRQSPWLKIIGEEYLQKAFEFAHQADPEMELYYNDYNLWKPAKRDGAVRLVRNLQEKGIKVAGIGMQGHYGLHAPSLEDIEASIEAFAALGVKVSFTEVDIDVLPNPSNRQGADIDATFEFDQKYNVYTEGLPDSVQQQLTQRYVELFDLFKKHSDKIDRVTFWGVTDNDSWLNNWPIQGRTSYPMLFDRAYQPKPAYEAVLKAAAKTK
ncbi:endo-1,4-beta-xylanase [Pontibacter akesuensis]|uniref:Beta-xylanase n=1 Tax=Pontibacter akesuensis TaxID=388950 RepID=A0A1I7JZJ4_9BACT|nr:endo-1,4-beta-xylanase [Pontibacter akesuensis]GHA76278.1 beta-xylanase [Pontibacter akesuensis]SFU90587.1 endo-1,4-beta-xylanase [Pontibacter akesuensis]